ncbi:MAG: hypothetical protein HQL37_04750 [Alphaproteobacteria bacterium]|nr:hypothetical protein [Alphaproteobacteria bacterium]
MLTPGEVSRALFGVWRLARLDAGGFAWFDTSLQGVRRSFQVAYLVAPIYLMESVLAFPEHATLANVVRFAILRVLAYVILWTAWPVLLFELARILGCGTHYARYLVAYNWFRMVEASFLIPVILLQRLPFVPGTTVETVILALTVLLIVYNWFIARVGLGLTGTAAFAMVVIDLLLSEIIDITAASLIRMPSVH